MEYSTRSTHTEHDLFSSKVVGSGGGLMISVFHPMYLELSPDKEEPPEEAPLKPSGNY